MADQQRRRGGQARQAGQRRAARQRQNDNNYDGIQTKYIFLALIILVVSITIYLQSTFLTSGIYNYGRKYTDGTNPRPINPYSAEGEAMKNLISRFRATQQGSEGKENNMTGFLEKWSTGGTFMLDMTDDEFPKSLEKEEFTALDGHFIDNLIEDIHETNHSRQKKQLKEDINQIERKVGARLTKFFMSPEELDLDRKYTTEQTQAISDERRLDYEMLNIRQEFVELWVKRLRELKEKDPKKYSTLQPENYTLLQKKYLKSHFLYYFQRSWDHKKNQQKRNGDKSKKEMKVPEQNPTEDDSNFNQDNFIVAFLDAIHQVGNYKLRNTLKEKKRQLKMLEGIQDVEKEINGVFDMFIEKKREEVQSAAAKGVKIKKYPDEYTEQDFEDFQNELQEHMKNYL